MGESIVGCGWDVLVAQEPRQGLLLPERRGCSFGLCCNEWEAGGGLNTQCKASTASGNSGRVGGVKGTSRRLQNGLRAHGGGCSGMGDYSRKGVTL